MEVTLASEVSPTTRARPAAFPGARTVILPVSINSCIIIGGRDMNREANQTPGPHPGEATGAEGRGKITKTSLFRHLQLISPLSCKAEKSLHWLV